MKEHRTAPRRSIAVIVALTVALGGLIPAAAALAAPPADFQDLGGLPLTSVTAPGSAVGHGPDGEPWLYLVSSGVPATFSVVDARDGSRVRSFDLPDAGGSWAVTVAPNGDVYTGTYGNGHLFRWVPGSDIMEDLSIPVPGETFVWSITSDAEGNIYGGTGQFGGHIFRYDPSADELTDFGALSDGSAQVMVRSLATSAEGLVYGLTYPVPQLIELDPDDGEYRELPLPPGADPAVGGYDLDVRGDLLFARFSESGPPSSLFVMDLETETWIQEIPGAHGLKVSELAEDGNTFYFVKDSELWAYRLDDRGYESTGVGDMTDRRGFGFVNLAEPDWPGESLIALTYRGDYLVYSPATGRSEVRYADAVAAAAPIRSIVEGPDGKVYAGGFLSGGLASYDPETGEKSGLAPEVGQAEGMAVHDGQLYIGTYPRAKILRLDPRQPLERDANPELVAEFYDEGQSRPYALVSAGTHLAVGFAPINGRRGGGLALIDTDTGEYWFEEVVPGHSVIGLTFSEGILYGATSVYSGAGGPRPDETDAVLFALDVETREMLWENRPLPGEGSFGDLVFDADGVLWTQSPTVVLAVDAETGDLIESHSYGDYPWEDVEYVHGAGELWVDPYTSTIMTMTQGALYSADPESLERTRQARPVSHGFLHSNGSVYLSRETSFFSHRFLDDRPTPAVALAAQAVAPGGAQSVDLTGFGPGERLELWSQPDGRWIATVNADETGAVHVEFTAPAEAGEARLVVTRSQVGTQFVAEYTARLAAVTVEPAETTVSEVTQEGVRVRASGFEPGATLSLLSDGTAHSETVADDTGAAEFRYQPHVIEPGSYRLAVSDGAAEAAATLLVQADDSGTDVDGTDPSDSGTLPSTGAPGGILGWSVLFGVLLTAGGLLLARQRHTTIH